MSTRIVILSAESFYSYLGEWIGGLAADPDRTFEELGFDSFHRMELITAVDELGIILEEDTLTEIETLADLYGAYTMGLVQQTTSDRE